MRIAIDAEAANASSREGFDGHKTYCYNIIRALLAAGRRHQFHLYMQDPPAYPFLVSGPNVRGHTIPVRWRIADRVRLRFPDPWRQLMLLPRLMVDRPDVYFQVAHEAQPVLCPARRLCVVHDLAFKLPRFQDTFDQQDRGRLRATTDAAVRSADHFIADSQSTKRDLQEIYGVPEDRVTVVYHGSRFEPADFDEARGSARQTLAGLGVSGPYILFVGVIEPRKNVSRLLDAFARVKARHGIDHKLVLAGRQGWRYREAIGAMERLPREVQDSVVLPGYVDNQALLALYSEADLFVFPGLYEGFGIPLLEAMAAGIPIVAARAGAIPEVVGDAALLFDPLDVEEIAAKIDAALSSPELGRDLVDRGRARRRQFSWDASAAAVLDVMEGLV